jgi:hypothetical protein
MTKCVNCGKEQLASVCSECRAWVEEDAQKRNLPVIGTTQARRIGFMPPPKERKA